jgi:hypothetical protein
MADAEHYMVAVCDFINTQEYLNNISIDTLREANSRTEIGITSLEVIMLVVNYLEARGFYQEFNPDWVSSLDSIQGIISVFREIDIGKAEMLTE